MSHFTTHVFVWLHHMRCDISSNITTTRVNGGDDNIDDDEDGDSSDDDSVDVMSPSRQGWSWWPVSA